MLVIPTRACMETVSSHTVQSLDLICVCARKDFLDIIANMVVTVLQLTVADLQPVVAALLSVLEDLHLKVAELQPVVAELLVMTDLRLAVLGLL